MGPLSRSLLGEEAKLSLGEEFISALEIWGFARSWPIQEMVSSPRWQKQSVVVKDGEGTGMDRQPSSHARSVA